MNEKRAGLEPEPSEPTPEPSAFPAGVDDPATPPDPYADRFALGGRSLRQHAARGALINSGFQVGIVGLGLIRNVAVAAFLTAAEFGFWALLISTLMTLAWLRQVGIGDKYIQQDDPDQVAAFQKAFTLELAYTSCFFVFVVAALPVYALIFDRSDIILPGLVLALSFLGLALQTPVWIAWRQMRFVRQRLLESIDPLVSTVAVITLAIAGAGYWALVLGLVAGSFAGAVAAVTTCPYPLRLRYDRGTLREYISFSWPLFAASASALVVVQGTVIVGNYTVGLAGIGAIGLASQVARFADQVDGIISRTIYPAICAVKDRIDLLRESFIKSNRLALIWGLPVGVGLTLFAPDLVDHVLGVTWQPAVPLLQGFGLIFAFRQAGFNWMLFFNARGVTRPAAVEGVLIVAVFAAVTVPMLFVVGLDGYLVGAAATVAVQLAVRAWYLGRLFEGFSFLAHLGRAFAPTAIAAAILIPLRVPFEGDVPLGEMFAEIALYVVVALVATAVIERRLLGEAIGYLRSSSAGSAEGRGEAIPA
ncbi:MAG: oligosaccharide flippase family protein [Solirubrobacterales bacterium]